MNKKPAEFWLMFAVIAITAWHVRSFLATKDAELASWIIGAVLGACCFLFAHRFFSGGAARVPAFFALAISAAYSVNMQYAYFDAKDIAAGAMIYDVGGWNFNALVLGLWAPTFEILLGWLFSAMTKGQAVQAETSNPYLSAIGAALAQRAVSVLQPKVQPVMQTEAQPAKPEPVRTEPSGNALQATAMRQNGMKIAEIAGALQVSERTVYNLLKPPKQPAIHTNGHSAKAAAS